MLILGYKAIYGVELEVYILLLRLSGCLISGCLLSRIAPRNMKRSHVRHGPAFTRLSTSGGSVRAPFDIKFSPFLALMDVLDAWSLF